ncbi:MAG: hypothetical protein KMY53_13005 [Desulfarculus sp.]|nr:hypothetical protein [Pseudomonadota bacterium]MBV1715579.1 hypothetical protein [Desulfarculus sp.]MBU4574177.1 hypothetical protein [Pseudomonadota bacterium]MBU4598290.1 hypothetical protein [Pseudomonadota bacterium]MBV1739081.1 hypothetical protein [Desulfarculus sp.]
MKIANIKEENLIVHFIATHPGTQDPDEPKFLAKNPAAKKFFEVFTLPLEDINEQNTLMNNGQKSQKDIERHVDDWIAKNQATWNTWLAEARKAAK